MRAYLVRAVAEGRSSDWADVADPSPGPGEVVVKVAAAALAWSDVLQMEGTYAGVVPDPPFVAGHEFAGVVAEAGPGTGFGPGERVFGFLPSPGAFAEFIAAPSWCLRRTPDDLADVPAAAFTTSYLTADAALVTMGGLRPGAALLVHAAAGGVGRSALQLARVYDAGVVVATAGSAARRSATAALGASATAGYDDFADVVRDQTAGRGVDVVLESVGGDVFDRSIDVIVPPGRLVTIGASSGVPPRRLKLPVLWQRSVTVCGLHIGRLMSQHPEVLKPSWERVFRLLAAGQIRPDVGLTVRSPDIKQGIDALHGRTVDGRVVIDFGPEDPDDERS